MAGLMGILLAVGLVLAVAGGLFVKSARAKSNGSWAGPAAIGSIVAIVGLAAIAFSVFALAGMALY